MSAILKHLNELLQECATERDKLISTKSTSTASDFIDIPREWYVYNRMIIDLTKIQIYAQKDLGRM